MTVEIYAPQVSLLLRAIPEIAIEDDFALKGGTAINLFVRNRPRLSVDIDLVYLPVTDRESSLAAIDAALDRIAARLRKRLDAKVDKKGSADGKGLLVRTSDAGIQIELSPVLRGTLFEPEMREVSEGVQEDFAFAEMKVVALPDLYAGKIAAALDRQHPRDLFDIKYLYENEGITNDIFQAFLVYLISHDRQPHELLDPRRKDIARDYEKHFVGMTREPVPLSDLLDARERLIEDIVTMAHHSAARQFLHSFFALEPDYSLLGLEADVAALPAVRWKILNLERLRREQRGKFDDQFARLDAVLRS